MLLSSSFPPWCTGADRITRCELRPVALAQSGVVPWILRVRRKGEEKSSEERGDEGHAVKWVTFKAKCLKFWIIFVDFLFKIKGARSVCSSCGSKFICIDSGLVNSFLNRFKSGTLSLDANFSFNVDYFLSRVDEIRKFGSDWRWTKKSIEAR